MNISQEDAILINELLTVKGIWYMIAAEWILEQRSINSLENNFNASSISCHC